MEERVLDDGLKSSVGRLFLNSQILKDVSGSGNNWLVINIFIDFFRIYLFKIIFMNFFLIIVSFCIKSTQKTAFPISFPQNFMVLNSVDRIIGK